MMESMLFFMIFYNLYIAKSTNKKLVLMFKELIVCVSSFSVSYRFNCRKSHINRLLWF